MSEQNAGTTFTDADLYGTGGNAAPRPRATDIEQDSINDCFFVATIGSTADRQPERIEDAIKYDPDTASFTVRLYERTDDGPREVNIPVSQQDVLDNLRRNGGSLRDNTGSENAPIWPAVMEVAYAKLHDTDHANGLDEGYGKINGGWLRSAMYALTGESGTEISRVNAVRTEQREPGQLFRQIHDAIEADRSVTFAAAPELKGKPQDGLYDRHAYMVDSISKNENDETIVGLRNPFGHNRVNGEPSANEPVVYLKLDDLLRDGGMGQFNIGPERAPLRQMTQNESGAQNPQQPASGETFKSTGDKQVDALLQSMSHSKTELNRALHGIADSDVGRQFREQGKTEHSAAMAAAGQREAQAQEHMQEASPTRASRTM